MSTKVINCRVVTLLIFCWPLLLAEWAICLVGSCPALTELIDKLGEWAEPSTPTGSDT